MSAVKKLVGVSVPVLALSAAAHAAEAAAGPINPETASGTTLFWWIAPISALCALGFAVYFYKKMIQAPAGTDKMIEIAQYVREGAYAYLFRQYSVVALVFADLVALFAFLAYKGIRTRRPGGPSSQAASSAACAASWA